MIAGLELGTLDLQNDLFSGTRLVERVVPTSGTTVRLRLEALGDGTSVRVLEYHRRAPGERRFHRVATEEQRVVAFAGLGLAQPFDELFGSADAEATSTAPQEAAQEPPKT